MSSDHNNENAPGLAARTEPELHASELSYRRRFEAAPDGILILDGDADVVMPLMNGKVMAGWLKATYPDLKVLFTSGYTDDALAHHGVLDPGVAFLPKPYTPATLTRKVRELLDTT
jgi:FixJ family two-component response regulator